MSETGDLFATEVSGADDDAEAPEADTPASGVKIPETLAKHRVLGPLLRKELSRPRPRPGYITGLADLENNANIKKALLALRTRLASREAELSAD